MVLELASFSLETVGCFQKLGVPGSHFGAEVVRLAGRSGSFVAIGLLKLNSGLEHA